MTHKRFFHLWLVFTAALLLLTISPIRTAQAAPNAICTFTSVSGNVNWGTNASWTITGSGCPATGTAFPGNTSGNTDNVVIISGSNVSLNVSPTFAIGTLTTNGPTGGSDNGLTINGANSLTTGAITMIAPSGNAFNTIAVGTGTLNAASITINGGNNINRLATLSVSTGTINVTGNITIGGTAAQTRLTFTGAGTLNLGGNLGAVGVFTPATGTVNFNGSGVQTIASSSITFNNLTISSGAILSIGTNTVTVSGTLTNLGTIRANRAVGSPGTFTFGLAGGPISGANLSIDVTTLGSLTNLQVDRQDSNHPNATTPIQTGYYWLITPTGSGYSANLTLPTNFTPDTNDKLCRYTGSGVIWDCVMTSFSTNSITRDGVSTFSPWAAGNNVGPTAITLDLFTAEQTGVGRSGYILGALALFTALFLLTLLNQRRARQR